MDIDAAVIVVILWALKIIQQKFIDTLNQKY